jgi:dihydrodipicolinate synthase/N-acetylneuraminate lyase
MEMGIRQLVVEGVIPNLIVPFMPEGNIEWDGIGHEISFLESTGVDGISVGASGSETAGSTANEFFRICEIARRHTQKPLIASILPDSEPEAIDLLEAVTSAGVDAVFIAQPHYLFQPDSASLLRMFERLRAHTAIPLGLANLLTSAPVDLATMTRMIDDSLIDGILQAGTDAHLMVDLLGMHPRVPVFSGMEDLHYMALLLGSAGMISGLATLFPTECVALYRDWKAHNYESVRERSESLLRLWRVLDHPVQQLSRIRLALAAQGRDLGPPRSPYAVRDPESAALITGVLAREGIATHAHGSR